MSSRQRTAVLNILASGPATALELARVLNIHQTSISRTLRPLELSGEIVRLLGRTRGARYGLARNIGSVGFSWPLYKIDAQGTPLELGTLHAVAPEHFVMHGGPTRIEGLTHGIPYYLQDARPAGFLGRAIPAAYPELGLPARVQDWSDDHVLTFLTQRGSDTVGNLILGAESLDRYLSGAHGAPIVRSEDRITRYPALARAAMLGATPASSAHGEHPKFSARVARGSGIVPVLVKFSPPRGTALGTRWADLLIAEFVASRLLSENDIPAARSEAFEFDGQVFLESERFDRSGADGRRGVVSLYSLDAVRYGKLDRWSLSARRLHAEGLLSSQELERVCIVDAFGTLIANTDQHFGNLTLFDEHEGRFELAPIYDMLPMLFAPQDAQLIERSFKPAGATATTLSVWPRARELAENYWLRLCEESRLSEEFRQRCERCLAAVRELSRRPTPSV
jgi:hypothetical protein